MQNAEDIVQIVATAATLSRLAATRTKNDTPAAQWRTLSILGSDGPHRLGELAHKSRVTQPGMTRLITAMTASGLVDKSADPDDSRVSVISATPAGLQALTAWKTQLGEALSPLFEELSAAEWNTVRSASRILLDAVARIQEEDK